MNDKKLTPRVGDRVIVQTEAFTGVVTTYTANVIEVDAFAGGVRVHVPEVQENGWWDMSDTTVVDRDPVEWPEGWSEYTDFEVLHEPSNVAIDRDALKHLLATGPAMLRDWPELMGGDA